MYTQKNNSKHLLSHSRATMALDHSRLGLENKFLENKSGRIFLRSTSLLYKFLPTNLRVCKPTFYTFYTYSSEVKQYFLSYRPRTEYVISKFFNVQDDQLWAFSETVQKISKITHTASRFSFLVRAVSVVECLNELYWRYAST